MGEQHTHNSQCAHLYLVSYNYHKSDNSDNDIDDCGDYFDGNFAADVDTDADADTDADTDFDSDADADFDADSDEVTNKVDPARHPHHNFRTSAKSFKQKIIQAISIFIWYRWSAFQANIEYKYKSESED